MPKRRKWVSIVECPRLLRRLVDSTPQWTSEASFSTHVAIPLKGQSPSEAIAMRERQRHSVPSSFEITIRNEPLESRSYLFAAVDASCESKVTTNMSALKGTGKPRALTFNGSTKARARLVSEIGILNSPFPASPHAVVIRDSISTKLHSGAPMVEEYQTGQSEEATEGRMTAVDSEQNFLAQDGPMLMIKDILEEKRSSTGVWYKVSWHESWVPEHKLRTC